MRRAPALLPGKQKVHDSVGHGSVECCVLHVQAVPVCRIMVSNESMLAV